MEENIHSGHVLDGRISFIATEIEGSVWNNSTRGKREETKEIMLQGYNTPTREKVQL